MSENEACAVAEALGGMPWHTGGGIWVVRQPLPSGAVVVVSPGEVAVYATAEDWHHGRSVNRIAWGG